MEKKCTSLGITVSVYLCVGMMLHSAFVYCTYCMQLHIIMKHVTKIVFIIVPTRCLGLQSQHHQVKPSVKSSQVGFIVISTIYTVCPAEMKQPFTMGHMVLHLDYIKKDI